MHRLNQVKDYYGGYIVNKILHKNKDNNYHDIETIIRVCEESQDFRKPITLFLI